MAVGLFLSVFVGSSYAQGIVEKIDKCDYGLDVGYTEETIKTTVPFMSGFIFKEEVQVEISGVLWMPCSKSHPKPPLMIFSHGSQNSGPEVVKAGFGQMARIFVENGFAVFVPIRKGFHRQGANRSRVTPDEVEPISCNNIAGNESGLKSAISDSKALYSALQSKKEGLIDFSKLTLIGQSRGAVVALGLAMDSLPGVTRIFNFAGGWMNESCDAGFLYSKFEEFGRKIRVPIISFYGTNDRLYGESFIRSSLSALEKGGAPSTHHIIPGGTHAVIYTHWSTWVPIVFPK